MKPLQTILGWSRTGDDDIACYKERYAHPGSPVTFQVVVRSHDRERERIDCGTDENAAARAMTGFQEKYLPVVAALGRIPQHTPRTR